MTDPFANPETRWIQTFSGRQYFPLAPSRRGSRP